jgi:acyl CoA:acetate/3-ketoacid CoA transferase
MTVESGGIGGFPASGIVFGAMIGAASVYDMANQFDLYDNGGLDICFMGALEVDRYGNVNAHRTRDNFSGIGGFANITAKTPTVVFCLTFNTERAGSRPQTEHVEDRAERHHPEICSRSAEHQLFRKKSRCQRAEGSLHHRTVRFRTDGKRAEAYRKSIRGSTGKRIFWTFCRSR